MGYVLSYVQRSSISARDFFKLINVSRTRVINLSEIETEIVTRCHRTVSHVRLYYCIISRQLPYVENGLR